MGEILQSTDIWNPWFSTYNATKVLNELLDSKRFKIEKKTNAVEQIIYGIDDVLSAKNISSNVGLEIVDFANSTHKRIYTLDILLGGE